MAAKEDIRKLLERLIRIAEPESRLLAFGSTVNGLGLRYSGMLSILQSFLKEIFSLTLVTLNLLLLRLPQDMDLCCLLDVKSSQMAASALVQTLGELLKQGKRCGFLF